MKNLAKYLFIVVILAVGCGKSSHQEHNDDKDDATDSPNQALYNQVMDIHDQVMPKSDESYSLKKKLQDKIAGAPDMAAEQKKKFNDMIAELDSADHSMMDWMHKFNPLPDSANQELAREYLENEMERIKKVRELVETSVQKAQEEVGKN
jgi:hypothetical protein